jgi:DNA segregation ATPase FtsK/SpoIIIE, S-DNA-T family
MRPMRLTVTSVETARGVRRDHLVELPENGTVGDLVAAVASPVDPARPGLDAFLVADTARTAYLGEVALDSEAPVRGSGIRPGAVLGIGGPVVEPDAVRVPAPLAGPALTDLHLVSGPDAGRVWRLGLGSYEVGVDPRCAIPLAGPGVPDGGVWLTVAADGAVSWHRDPGVEDADAVRPAGLLPPPEVDPVLGLPLDRTPPESRGADVVPPDDLDRDGDDPHALPDGGELVVGCALLRVRRLFEPDAAVEEAADGIGVDYNRPPRIAPHVEAERVRLPNPPTRLSRLPFPLLMLAAPVVMGLVMVGLFKSYFYLAFIAFTPMMAIGNWAVGKRTNRRQQLEAWRQYRLRRRTLEDEIRTAVRHERAVRQRSSPDPATAALHATGPGGLLWERRRRDPDHLLLRLGTVDLPSLKEIDDPARDENHRQVRWTVRDVPAGTELTEVGVLGVAGTGESVQALGRWLIAQTAVLHSPRDVRVVVLTVPQRAAGWAWTRWLPHARPLAANGPVAGIGTDPESVASRVAELVAAVQARQRILGSSMGRAMFTDPDIVVIADGARRLRDVPGMVQILAEGPQVRVFSICLDEQERLLPEECGAVVSLTGPSLTLRRTGLPEVTGIRADLVRVDWCEPVARALAPIRDVSPDNDSGLPGQVTLLDLLDQEPPDPSKLVARWQRRPASTSFLVGTGYDGPLALDLVRDGPHGLVAGTTGSGKSELLQTMVVSLAAANRPDELALVLVDYKGGSAFRECAGLPHTLGMVTDLDAHLVGRALDSLGAELRRRERILARAEAKDHPAYRQKRAADPSLPRLPRLLLVIDEFATLVREVPDFVPGLISIAQRGRSLGIHLILATQRPAGAVTPDIKANTNLRIALRVTDAVESQDIIDTAEAVHISPSTPGRALVRYGHRNAAPFQSAWVGAARPSTGDVVTGPRATVRAVELPMARLGRPAELPSAPDDDEETVSEPAPTDLQALVAAIGEAADQLRDYEPQPSPWLPALDEVVLLDDLPPVGDSMPPPIPYALEDIPALQERRVATVDLNTFGHLYVIGAPRTGRSQVLRTIAASAAARCTVRDVHIYGIDAAGGALAALEALPHCGAIVSRHDMERMERLLRRLIRELTTRQEAAAAAGCAGLIELRRQLPVDKRPPHLLLLIDGWDALSPILDEHDHGQLVGDITRLVREGAAAGIHVIASSERALLGGRLAAHNDHKLLLRQADRNDYQLVGILPSKVPDHIPAGRGWHVLSRTETQVALLSADESGQGQAEAVRKIAARTVRTGPGPFRVAGIPARVDFTTAYDLVAEEQRRPMWALLGVGGDEGGALGVDLTTTSAFLIGGASGSGRSNALASVAVSLLAGGTSLIVLTPRESPLRALARHPQVRLLTAADPSADEVQAALTACDGPRVVIVDDADLLGNPAADRVLKEVAASGRDRGMAIVYAGALDALNLALASWLHSAKRARQGVLLAPRSTTEGDIIGVRLTTSQVRTAFPIGRGFTTAPGGAAASVQVPFTELRS